MMKITHPDFRDQNEVDAKLWDDLYIMSNYDLNIDSPFPKPIKKSIEAKPTIKDILDPYIIVESISLPC